MRQMPYWRLFSRSLRHVQTRILPQRQHSFFFEEAMSRLIDLSHRIDDAMVTYPGLPAPQIRDFMSREESRTHYAPGTEFLIAGIDLVGNTGTYVDSPAHRYKDGDDLSSLALEQLAALPTIVVASAGQGAIGPLAFAGMAVRGKAVLLRTDWSRHWGTDQYFHGHPYLTAEGAHWLREQGTALVGIDSLNIDSTDGGERPAHSELLRHGIPIVEHLTGLAQVPEEGALFFAVPPKVRGMASFPVRAFCLVT
jgi:arylformamidase